MECAVVCLFSFSSASVAGARVAWKGLKSSDEELIAMSKVIGTKNPQTARRVCRVAVVFLSFMAVVGYGSMAWFLIDAFILDR